jgi:hypothetical protein
LVEVLKSLLAAHSSDNPPVVETSELIEPGETTGMYISDKATSIPFMKEMMELRRLVESKIVRSSSRAVRA